MRTGEHRKFQVKVGEKAYVYRGKVLSISDGYVTIEDVKTGLISIRISEIITDEPYYKGQG